MKTRFIIMISLLVGFMFGMVSYSLIDNSVEEHLMPVMDTCIAYEYNMDMALILLQKHCLVNVLAGRNIPFCDLLNNETTLLLYEWNNP